MYFCQAGKAVYSSILSKHFNTIHVYLMTAWFASCHLNCVVPKEVLILVVIAIILINLALNWITISDINSISLTKYLLYGFSSLALLAFWITWVFVMGAVHCRMFSNIPCFYPSILLSSQLQQPKKKKKKSSDIAKWPEARNHLLSHPLLSFSLTTPMVQTVVFYRVILSIPQVLPSSFSIL
jgi:hypothetical protein